MGAIRKLFFDRRKQALAEARRAADDLEAISLSQRLFPDGYDVFAKECMDAAGRLRPLDWGAIHAEKYSVTPEVVYFQLVKNAEALMRKEGDEERRRSSPPFSFLGQTCRFPCL